MHYDLFQKTNCLKNNHSLIQRMVFLLLICFVLTYSCGKTFAQPVSEPEKTEKNEVKEADKNSPTEQIIDRRYDRIYVPEKDLAEYWPVVKSGVLLSTKEFRELLAQAEEAKSLNEGQPLGIVVEKINYSAKVTGDELSITAKCFLVKYKPGWARFVLPVNNVYLQQAKLGNKTAPLGRVVEQKGKTKVEQLVLIDDFVGKQELVLELTTPIQRIGTDEIAIFSLFPRTAAQLTVAVPASRVLQVNGAVLETEAEHKKDRQVRTSVGGNGTIQLRISDALGESLNESLVFARTAYAIGVERDTVNWQAQCQIDLFGKRFNRLEFSVPTDLEITSVDAPGLQGWELEDDPGKKENTKITLTFRETIPEQIRVMFNGVQLLPESDNWRVAPLKLYGVTSHTGGLALSVADRVRLKTLQLEGIRPSERQWNPNVKFLHQGNLHFYDVWNENFDFHLSTSETVREVQAAVTNILDINETEILLSSTITLQTLFSPLYEVNLEMPAQWSPKQIYQRSGEIDWQYASKQAGVHRLKLPLTPPLQPNEKRTIQIAVQLNQEGGKLKETKQIVELPEVKLQGIKILEGSFAVRANKRLEVVPKNIKGMDPAYLGIDRERFGFQYQDSRIAGEFEITRKPTRFNVSTVQVVSIDDETITLRYRTTFDVVGGGLRELTARLSSKATVNEEFQVLQGARISDQKRTKTETGTEWNLRFDRYVTGKIPLLLTVILPRKELLAELEKASLEEQFSVPELVFEAAELQEQYLAFSARTDQQITTQVTNKAGTLLEPVDLVELPILDELRSERIVAAYHSIKPGVEAFVSEYHFDPEPIPTMIGHELLLESLLLESGQFQQQARLSFAAVGVQSLRVQLPPNTKLWSTSIDGVPVTARKVGQGFIVSLANNNSTTQSRTIEVLYGNVDFVKRLGAFSTPSLPAPQFSVLTGAGEAQPLEVLKTAWHIHHSTESQINPLGSEVELIDAATRQTWVTQLVDQVTSMRWVTMAQNGGMGLLYCLVPAGLVWLVCSSKWGGILTGGSIVRWGVVFGSAAVIVFAGYFLILSGVQSGREADKGIIAYGENNTPDVAMYGHADLNGVQSESDAVTSFEALSGRTILGESKEEFMLMPKEGESKKESERLSRTRRGLAKAEKSKRAPQLTPEFESQAEITDKKPADSRPAFEAPVQATEAPKMPKESGGKPFDPFNETTSEKNDLAEEKVDRFKDEFGIADGKRKPGRIAQSDGLLSLQMTMKVPENLKVTKFQTLNQLEGSLLKVQYLSQTAVNRIRWFILSIVVLIYWLLRRTSGVVRSSWFCLSWGLPIAGIGVISALFLPLLEGVLLGALVGTAIWFSVGVLQFIQYLLCLCGQCLNKNRSVSTTALGLFLLAGLILQEPAVAVAKGPHGKKPATNSAAQPPQPGAKMVVSEPEKIPLVFPYSEKESVLSVERVFVPKGEYLKLWKIAHPGESIAPAPFPYLVHEASYVAELQDSEPDSKQRTVSVKARYVIRNFTRKEQIVPLPLESVVIESATINEKSVSLTLLGKNQPAVLLPAEKLSLVDLEFRIPANSVGAAGQFEIPLRSVAAGSFSFLLPDKESQVRVNDGKIPYQIVTRDKKNYANLVVTSGGTYVFSWQPKISTSQLQFLSSESSREVLVQDTGAELRYSFAMSIAQGSFSEVEFVVPEGVKLKSLSGSDLAGWQMLDKGKIRVLLKRAVDDRTVLFFSLFAPLEISTQKLEFEIPDLIPQGITREIGSWAVSWNPSISARFTELKGVRQINVGQFRRLSKSTLVPKPQRVYRFSSRPQQLRLEVTRKASSHSVQQYTLADIQQHKTHIATFAKINIKGEPRLSVDFSLPSNLNVVELTATSLSDWFVTEGEKNRSTLTVLFDSPQLGAVQVVARGNIQQEIGNEGQISLIGLQLNDADQTVSYLGLGAAEILGVSLEAMDGWRSVDPQSVPAELKKMAGFPIRLSMLNTTNSPRPVTVSLSRQKAQVKANSVCLIAVTETSIDYGLSMQWIISKAATDRFSFVGPKWLQGRIEFQSPGIRQVSTKEIDDRKTLWIIETREPHSDQFFLTSAVTLPSPKDRTISTPEISFVEPDIAEGSKPVALEIQSQYALLVNLGKDPLEPISEHGRLLVQQKELPITVPEELLQQAMEIVRLTKDVIPSWEIKQRGKHQSPPANVMLAQLKTVLGTQGAWRTKAIYTVKNRQRQFLPLVLPFDSELLSVIVSGKPSKALQKTINKEPVYLIPLPPSGEADLATEVEVVLQGKLEQSLLSGWSSRKVALPSPRILSPSASEKYGIPVMYTTWELSTPRDLIVRTNSSSNMNLSSQERISQLSLEGKLKQMSELNRIISGKSNSFEARCLARDNLKELQKGLEKYQEESVTYQVGDSITLQLKQQQQVLDETIKNIDLFAQEAPQSQSRGEQRFGRNYIESNNSAILNFNGGQGVNLMEKGFPFGQNQDKKLQQAAPQKPSSRINAPEIKGKMIQKKGAPAKNRGIGGFSQGQGLENRKSLREENQRQNFFFDNSLNRGQQSRESLELFQRQLELEPSQRMDINGNDVMDFSDDNVDGIINGIGGGMGGEGIDTGLHFIPSNQNDFSGVMLGNQQAEPTHVDKLFSLDLTDEQLSLGRASGEIPAAKWTAVGGLSLPVDLPSYEHSIVFSKVEGNPELIVEVHSFQLVKHLFGWGWGLFCLLLLLWVLKSLKQFSTGEKLHRLYLLLLVIGLGAFVLLPNPLGFAGMTLAVVSGILYAERVARLRKVSVSA